MRVKKYYLEYENWKTQRQWKKEGFVIVDRDKAVELWTSQWCCCSAVYASPDNVRPMTQEEVEAFKQEIKEQRRKAADERKLKKEQYERRLKYADELREAWHTEWQWLRDYRRTVKDGARWKVGKTLNEWIGRDWCVFGSNYCYFNIEDTTLITDEKEYLNLLDESNRQYLEG